MFHRLRPLFFRSFPHLVLVCSFFAPGAANLARELTFEDRVRAQEALERVYHAHVLGAKPSFEQVVPRALLEHKVRKYLRQGAALEHFWHTPLTTEMLERESERMARQTRMPERLRELYAALGHDGFLVQECLARPALVDRLTRRFFDTDERIHGRSGPEAEHPSPKATWDAWWTDHAADFDALVSFDAVARTDAPLPVVIENPTEGALCQPDDTWVPDSTPEGNTAPAVWTGSLMLFWGGRPAAGSKYDPATDTWAPVNNVGAPATRSGHTAVWTGTEMIVWGGVYVDGVAYSHWGVGGRYDPASDTWSLIAPGPEGRINHTAVWTGTEMMVWGGSSTSCGPSGALWTCSTTYHNSGGRYVPASNTWLPVATAGAPSARELPTSVWTGSEVIVWGGGFSNGAGLNSGARYDPVTNSWTLLPPAPLSGTLGHSAVWIGDAMLVWGGSQSGAYSSDGARYRPATNSWTPTSSVGAPGARSKHTAVWTGSAMIVWGGSNGSFLQSGGRYLPTADSWTPTATTNAPAARIAHRAVWTGDLMLVWGGSGGVGALDSGGRYDPGSDSWTPMLASSAPEPRGFHTAVWTGSHMLVWGGLVASNSYSGTGGRYDPATDDWTPMSVLDGPSARRGHTAVWTGTEMVVWGGVSGVGAFDTGARYEPFSDTWSATTTTGAPTARSRHTAVWTGDRMVVWGGNVQTGGLYDPETDAWTPTSTAGAPSPRSEHTAVWTGTKMVVWGGEFTSNPLATGGRYDPVSDTWAPTSITGAPFARAEHVAVWTGQRMVVWGSDAASTGGRYDPVEDFWKPTSLVNAPPSRLRPAAVWTGSSMIVWGGYVSSLVTMGWSNGVPSQLLVYPSVATGARYDPTTDTWTSVAEAYRPTERQAHTAVWSGSAMLVWGGFTGYKGGSISIGTSIRTGGRYVLGLADDDDGDGLSECDGDCNDVDPRVQQVPGAVTGLAVLAEPVTLISFTTQESDAGTSTSYDLVAGYLADLRATHGFGLAWCVGSFPDTPAEDDGAALSPGEGVYYLLRAVNGCGVSSYGAGSDGRERVVLACP